MTNLYWQDLAKDLWGERWKSALALTAKVNKRTVQRWNAGNEPNKAIIDKLIATHAIWCSNQPRAVAVDEQK